MKQYKLLGLFCMSLLSGIALADNVFLYTTTNGFSNVQVGGQEAKIVSVPQGTTSNSVQGALGIGNLSGTLNSNIKNLQQGDTLTIKYSSKAPDNSSYASFNLYKNNQLVTPNGFAYAPQGASSPFSIFYVQDNGSQYWQQVTFTDSDTIYIMLDGVPYNQYQGKAASVTLEQGETITSLKIGLLGTTTGTDWKSNGASQPGVIEEFSLNLDLKNVLVVGKSGYQNLLDSLVTSNNGSFSCSFTENSSGNLQCTLSTGDIIPLESFIVGGLTFNEPIKNSYKIVGVSMTYTTSKNPTPKVLIDVTKINFTKSTTGDDSSQLSVDGSVNISDLSKFTTLWFSPVFTTGGAGEYQLSSANFNTVKSALSAGPVEVSFIMSPSGSSMSGKIVATQGVTQLFEQSLDAQLKLLPSAAKIARVNLTALGGVIGGVGNKAMSSTIRFYPPASLVKIASMTPQQIASQLSVSQKSELLTLLGGGKTPSATGGGKTPSATGGGKTPSATGGGNAEAILGNVVNGASVKALVAAVNTNKITKTDASNALTAKGAAEKFVKYFNSHVN